MADDAHNAQELTEEQAQRVAEIRTALVQELSAPRTSVTKALQDMEDLRDDFLQALRQIVKFSDNDSLKAKVAMWGYEQLLAQREAMDDPATKFFQGLADATQRDSAEVTTD